MFHKYNTLKITCSFAYYLVQQLSNYRKKYVSLQKDHFRVALNVIIKARLSASFCYED